MSKNKFLFLICFALIIVTACEQDDGLIDRGQPAQGAGLKGMHMSPNAPSFNIMIDSTRSLTVLSGTGGAESGLAFGSVVPTMAGGYGFISPGNRTVSAKVPFTSTTTPGATIAAENYDFKEGKFYTVAAVDSLSRMDFVIVEDDRNVEFPNKAYFRIANLMVGGTADVNITSTTAVHVLNVNNIPFKTFTNFDTLPVGTYKVLLRANGATTRLDSITAFAASAGRKYTLYTRGVVGQTGTSTRRPLIFQMTNF